MGIRKRAQRSASTGTRSTAIRDRLAIAAIAFAGVFGFLHYITKGPNEVSDTDERKADDLAKGKGA